MRVAVIGAGASGIVTAKYLLAEGYAVTIFEQGSRIGGTFVNKA
jgi:phytoene dehydrogenase-like protein